MMIMWGTIFIAMFIIALGVFIWGIREDEDSWQFGGGISAMVIFSVMAGGTVAEPFNVYEAIPASEINVVSTKSNVIVEHGDYIEIINDISTYTALQENPDLKFQYHINQNLYRWEASRSIEMVD